MYECAVFFTCPSNLILMILSFTGLYPLRFFIIAFDKNKPNPVCLAISLPERINCPPQLVVRWPLPAQ